MTGGEGAAGARRVLVLVNEEVRGGKLRDALMSHLDPASTSEVRVVAPALTGSTFKQVMGDIDEAIPDAQDRLDRTLEELRDAGIEAEGEVGDSDPLIALSDSLRAHGADEIVIVAHAEPVEQAEDDLLARAKREFTEPIVELRIELDGGEPRVVDTQRAPEGLAEAEPEHEFSANLPPLRPQDMAGLAVGILGTLVLAFLAADCADTTDESPVTGACAARTLIALFAALLNLAHLIGIFLMESVRYRGLFHRFFARLTLIGTPIAIVVSLLLG